jgi:hypothetical protein
MFRRLHLMQSGHESSLQKAGSAAIALEKPERQRLVINISNFPIPSIGKLPLKQLIEAQPQTNDNRSCI